MYLVVLPIPTNHDSRAAIRVFETAVIEQYGGFTRVAGTGAWRDPQGHTIKDCVWRYEIAAAEADDDDDDTRLFLPELLARVGRMMKQNAMFWVMVPCKFCVQTVEP